MLDNAPKGLVNAHEDGPEFMAAIAAYRPNDFTGNDVVQIFQTLSYCNNETRT